MGLDSGAIYNYSCNDSLVAHSSAESEIRAADKIIRTIIFVKDVLTWIGLAVSQAVTIYVDNEAMIDIATTMKASDNLKHINICINYIREKVNDGTVELKPIDTLYNISDIHTKCLTGTPFTNHRGKIMHGFNNNADNIHRYMTEYM
jgi:hypothetical protein